MGYVYLICDAISIPERYKIGITKKDVKARIKQLSTGSSSELTLLKVYESENYRRIETILHRTYKPYSTDGGKEWFELPDDKVISFADDCVKIDYNIKLMLKENPYFK
jgi:hypothetical protein